MMESTESMIVNTKAIHVLNPDYGGWMGRNPWTLCVGAGISYGIVPTWENLAWKVYQQCFDSHMTIEQFREMRNNLGWTLDCVLQMSRNSMLCHQDDKEFNEILRKILYEDILGKAKNEGVLLDLIMAFNTPYVLLPEKKLALCDFFEKYYAETTTYQLINFVLDAYENGKAPRAIISFNAECIFDTFLYLFFCKRDMHKIGEKYNRRRYYTRILRTVECQKSDLIPIYHLHGCIFPNDGIKNKFKRSSSYSKLVFNEESYMQVAGSVYNWAQTTFLYHAQFDKLLFIGLSMSDLNIRKWLYWTAMNHNFELTETRHKTIIDMCHMWINKSTEVEASNLEDSLSHLNVRCGYLQSWNDIGLGLRNLFGLLNSKDKKELHLHRTL